MACRAHPKGILELLLYPPHEIGMRFQGRVCIHAVIRMRELAGLVGWIPHLASTFQGRWVEKDFLLAFEPAASSQPVFDCLRLLFKKGTQGIYGEAKKIDKVFHQWSVPGLKARLLMGLQSSDQ